MVRKDEFLLKLRLGLSGLPANEIEERIAFYSELIDDLIEDGRTEEDATAEMGDVNEIIESIVSEIPIAKIVKGHFKEKRNFSGVEIALLVLGSPIWLSLMIAVLAVIFSIYVSLWSVIISLWAVFVSVIATAFGGIIAGGFFTITGKAASGVALIGVAIFLLGLSVFLFFGCNAATKGIIALTKAIFRGLKRCFVGKKEVKHE